MSEENVLVEMTDAEGNTFLYSEELVIQVDGDDYAFLIPVCEDEEGHIHEDCDCCDDEVIIAKIVINEDGEEEYIEPTDEEFEKVTAAYDELMSDDD